RRSRSWGFVDADLEDLAALVAGHVFDDRERRAVGGDALRPARARPLAAVLLARIVSHGVLSQGVRQRMKKLSSSRAFLWAEPMKTSFDTRRSRSTMFM